MAVPNVLVFIPHDLGDTLGCYGYSAVRSPHLDALARRGVRFSNCFTTSPECTPSRGGLWTGLYPHQNGLMGLSNFGWSLRPEVKHVARHLAEAGYDTHLFGFQHECKGDPSAMGYGHVHATGMRPATEVCRDVREFLKGAAARAGRPWFVCAGFRDVHRPWKAETSFSADTMKVPPYLPDNKAVRNDLALFLQAILDMDAAVGETLEALRATGLDRETLVIFTTDHGAAFPRAKATLYDPGLRVPLVMHWPGHVEGGEVFDELISNLDVTPTLLNACGGTLPDGLEGRSFLPLLEHRDYEERDAVFGALFYDVAYDPMHYVRTKTHKYIRSFAVTDRDARGADPEVLSSFRAGQWIRVDDLDVLTSAAWQSMETPCPRPPAEELYDLREDPWEQRNLADEAPAQDVLKAMRGRMKEMMVRTSSPLLDGGHVPPPEAQREAFRKHRPGSPLYKELTRERDS